MRKGNSRRVFINVTKIAFAAICFAVTFAVVFTGGIFDINAAGDNIAFADKSGGGTATFSGDRNLTYTDFGSPLTDVQGKTRTWTSSYITANGHSFNGNNVSWATSTGEGFSVNVSALSGGGFKVTSSSGWGVSNPQTYWAVYYETPAVVKEILNIEGVAVNAVVNLTIRRNEPNYAFGTDDIGYNFFASSGALAATDGAIKNKGNYSLSTNFEKDWNISDIFVPLTKNSSQLILSFYDQTGNWGELDVDVKNISIRYQVTIPTDASDNVAPLRGSVTAVPYLTEVNDSWYMYANTGNSAMDAAINNLLKNNVDSGANEGSQTVNLKSFTNKSLGKANGRDYYKEVNLSFNENAFNYGTNYMSGISGWNDTFTSGIGKVTIGVSDFDVSAMADGAGTAGDIRVDDVVAAYATVTRTDRNTVTINIKYYANASNLSVTVVDNGNLSTTTTVNVSGIDNTAPDALAFDAANNENYLTEMAGGAFDGSVLNWITDGAKLFSPETGDWDGAPYVWYYDVKFSARKPASDWFVQQGDWQNSADLLKGKTPFAVGTVNAFDFNFLQGKTRDGILPLSYSENDVPKGAGYYLFTFYTMDLAGNVCAVPSSYVMKVDNVAPENFAVDVRPDGVSLGGDYSSVGKWAKKYLEYSLSWQVSLSGNKLAFKTPDGTEYKLYFSAADDAEQKIVKIERNGSDVELTGGSSWSSESVSIAYSVSGGTATLVVKVTDTNADGAKYTPDGSAVFTVSNNGVDTTGMYNALDTVDGHWQYNGVTGAVAMRLDTVAPDLLEDAFADKDGKYLQQAGTEAFAPTDDPAGREWYTDEWSIGTLLTFTSDETDIKYAGEAKLYIGLKNFTDGDAIRLFDADFRGKFASAQDYDALFTGAGWDWTVPENYIYTLNAVLNGDGGSFTPSGSDVYGYSLDLDPAGAREAGVRVIYLWAVDQAGNTSGLYSFGIYTDANNYQISFGVDGKYAEKFGEGLVDAKFVDSPDGQERTYYKRGDDVYLVINKIKDGFVPYEIKKNDRTGSRPAAIYRNDGYGQSLTGGSIVEDYGAYAQIMGEDIIRFAVDRISLGTLPIGENKVANITMSFRQCVEITVTENNMPYTSAPVDTSQIYVLNAQSGTLIDEDVVRGALSVMFWNTSGGNIPVPKDVGEYRLSFRLTDGGGKVTDFYVLSGSEEILDENKVEFFIQKGTMTITVGGASVFGDTLNVTFEVSGLAGEDEQEWNDGEGTLPGTFGEYGVEYEGKVYGGRNSAPFEGFMPAGTYPLVCRGFTAQNYNVVVQYKNDVPTYTVSPYALTVTAQDSGKIYGADDPAQAVFKIAKDVYDKFNDAVGGIFGSGDVSADGQYYAVAVPSAAMLRRAGEDAGVYSYVSVNAMTLGLNENFTIALASEGNGVFTIAQRTIRILPEAGQRIFGETPEELAKIVYSFVNPDDGRFASEITGYLGVTPAEGESKERFITLGELAAVNPDNIKIELANKEVIITVYDGDDVVTLTWKGGALETVFGTLFDKALLENLENYDKGESDIWQDGDELKLVAEIVDYSGRLSDARNYTIRITVTYIRNGEVDEELAEFVNIVGANRLTVVPATVTVTPEIAGSGSKVYGNPDEWQFGFKFEGVPEGYTFDESKLNVALVRALYEQNGEFVREGARYDDVIPANGRYYGVYARTFASADPNVKAVWADGAPENLRLTITPKEINLDTLGADKFTGVNKPTNDGSASVPYDANGKRTAINITGELVNGDGVWLDFAANYYEKNGQMWVNTGESTEERDRFTNLDIRFSDFVLKGDKADNYKIVCAAGYVTIEGRGADEFYIVNVVELHVSKSDFSVAKVYDGTSVLDISHVTFAQNSDIADWNGVAFAGRAPVFGSRNVGDNYIVTLSFLIPNATVESVIFEGASGDMSLSQTEGGVVLTVQNVKAVITRRVIGLDEIVFVIAPEKIYDGTAEVEVGYSLADGVVQKGDLNEDLGLKFSASLGSKNVQIVEDGGYAAQTASFHTAEIANANYALEFTADDLNAHYSGESAFGVTVMPAELVLEFEFDRGKVYDGDEELVKGDEFDSVDIAVKTPVSGWESEKNGFSVNLDAARYYYSDSEGNGYRYVQVDAEGNAVRHDVTADGIVFTVSDDGSFVPSNYTFYGKPVADGQPVSVTAGSVAPMAKKTIKPNLSEIKAVDKVYDGTKNAEESVNFFAMINGLDIPEDDKKSLKLTYKAEYDSANAGANRTIKISEISVAIGESNQGVADSYSISISQNNYTLSGARITKAPLAVEFALPDKVFNGRMFDGVDEEVIDAAGGYVKFGGFFLDDAKYYDILVKAAGYNYVNVDKSDVKDGVEAYVYGFRLTDNRKPSADPSELNYYPVFASLEAELAGYTPVERTAALPATDEAGRKLYYYEFNTGSYYKVPTEKLSGLTDEDLAQLIPYILAAYDDLDTPTEVTGSTPTLLIRADVPQEIKDKIQFGETVSAVYGAASGNITPATINWSVDIKNRDVLTKTFDDTDKFYGVRGDRNDPDNDFEFNLGGEYGFVVSKWSAKFDTVNVGGRIDIIFSIHEFSIDGSESSIINQANYKLNARYTVPGGTITKARLDVSLAANNAEKDAFEFVYGDTPAFEFAYTYNDRPVFVNGGAAYMAVEDYKAAFAHALDASDYLNRLYNIADGQPVKAADGAYVRLNGSFGEVTAVTQAASVSDVGSYTLDGVKGSADNFELDAKDNSAAIEILPADLAVTVNGEADGGGYYYTMEYGVGSLPVPDFNFVGFRNGDTAEDLDGFADKYGFYLYGQDGRGEKVQDAFARISSALGDGAFYALGIDNGAVVGNYKIVFSEDGAPVYKLNVVRPVITGVAADDGALAVTYDGNNHKIDENDSAAVLALLTGIAGDGSYSAVIDWTGDSVSVTDAGQYGFVITVNRAIAGDVYGYGYAPLSVEGVFTVRQRNVTLSAGQTSFTYNGREQTSPISFGGDGIADADGELAANLKITYGGAEYMLGAGSYELGLEGSLGGNYAVTDNITGGRLSVNPAVINVIVDKASEKQSLAEGGVGIVYDYTLADASLSGLIDESKFTVRYTYGGASYSGAVHDAGVYSYSVRYDDADFKIAGGVGTLKVVKDTVVYESGGGIYAVVKLPEEVASPYSLSYGEILKEGNAQASDDVYYDTVDGYVQGKLAADKENATVLGILGLRLSDGNRTISSLSSPVEVSVRLPQGAASADGYKLYTVRDGGLTEITDYTVSEDGFVTYTTDYIGNLVFVQFVPAALPFWIWILVGVLGALLLAGIILGVVVSRQRAAAAAALSGAVKPRKPSRVNNNRKPPVIGIK